MNIKKSAITYPGSDCYSPEELAAPGRTELPLGEAPLVRAIDTAYIMFQLPDLNLQGQFLQDFGLVKAGQNDKAIYMRGYGHHPYIYSAYQGDKAAFLGAGFMLASEEALQKVAIATSRNIEPVDGPGGGVRVRLKDPDGFIVDLVHGRAEVEPLSTRREPLPVNLPDKKTRINRGQRPALEPSAVERFGHYVIMASDFEASWHWYRKHLGILPTDVLCTATGRPFLTFNRLDRDSEPADHHTVVLARGPRANYLHSAFETLDIDSIGQGQQYLKTKGWKHWWGIGRHILGSQIFDYWQDPYGYELEHYADGDVFDNNHVTQYHLADRGSLWAWGNDVPSAVRPKPKLKDIIKLIFGNRENRAIMLEMKSAMERKPRPWLK
ncbi:MAG: VOC family protein [Candidatus Thiodiazotropha sp.]